MSSLVLRADDGPVAHLTLNRPDKLNALSPELFLELRTHLEQIRSQIGRTKCVVLKGAGRSFCAGADIEALRAGVAMRDPEFRSQTVELVAGIPQTVIAAVHGHCYTGGLELALAADIIVAAADIRFRDTHAILGIVPRWGMSARLPRRVGLANASRISISCRPIEAEEALRISLCDYVVASDQLDDFSSKLAAEIATHSAASIAAIRHLYEHSLLVPIDAALAHERNHTASPTGLANSRTDPDRA